MFRILLKMRNIFIWKVIGIAYIKVKITGQIINALPLSLFRFLLYKFLFCSWIFYHIKSFLNIYKKI